MVGLRCATAAELATVAGDQATVRLSWSARPERIEQCRRLSDAELAERPAHMRLRLECTGRFARYRIAVNFDGRLVREDTIRGGGLRQDRPMHLFEEFRLPAGERRVVVQVVRIDSATLQATTKDSAAAAETLLGGREAREIDERRRRAGEEVPPVLSLDTAVTLSRGQVLLVTYDGSMRRLVARASGTR